MKKCTVNTCYKERCFTTICIRPSAYVLQAESLHDSTFSFYTLQLDDEGMAYPILQPDLEISHLVLYQLER